MKNVNIRMDEKKLQALNEFCIKNHTTKEVLLNYAVDKILSGELRMSNKRGTEFDKITFTNSVCALLKSQGAKIETVTYERCQFYIINGSSVFYVSFRKMGNESLVFSVRAEVIQKLKRYAMEHKLTPYVASFCDAPLKKIWIFASLDLVPTAQPKNKTESYYLSSVDQTLFYRVAEENDFEQIKLLSKESLSPKLYEVFVKRFG